MNTNSTVKPAPCKMNVFAKTAKPVADAAPVSFSNCCASAPSAKFMPQQGGGSRNPMIMG